MDSEQAAAIDASDSGFAIVEGPPGSGKTLVLAARARRLAEQHPKWRIQILCYNKMLVGYLKSLVSDHPNIEVHTFLSFISQNGYSINYYADEDTTAARCAQAIRAFSRTPFLDALLIDEAQDFSVDYLLVALAALKPHKGGALFVGDPQQALYQAESSFGAFRETLRKKDRSTFELPRPYRSTKQILKVTSALSNEGIIKGLELAFNGPPVDLIYSSDRNAQGDAVARDIAALLDGGGVSPQQIGVLVTRKNLIGTVMKALELRGIPSSLLFANWADMLNLDEPTVKVMTVHSAKGLEFDHVFLIGLEQLPNGDTPEAIQKGRAGFVGMTRAKDRLVITYSRANKYLERIRDVGDEFLNKWVWPDDFPEEASNG